MDPWWNEQQAAWIGTVGGPLCGILGGTLGTVGGICAPRGKCKALVYSLIIVPLALGVIALVAGVVALALGQPYGVWYPLVLLGGIPTVVLGSLLPVFRLLYRQAESRRLEAEELRRS
jgi:hypothetical protein